MKQLSDAEKDMIKTHKTMIPFPTPRPAKDIKYKFAYVKPSYVNVVGSFALKTMVKESSGNNVDVVVQMPSVCKISCSVVAAIVTDNSSRASSKRRTT